jgi:hypothetical protein
LIEDCYNEGECALDLTKEKSEDPYTDSYRKKLKVELEEVLKGFSIDGIGRIEALIRQLRALKGEVIEVEPSFV